MDFRLLLMQSCYILVHAASSIFVFIYCRVRFFLQVTKQMNIQQAAGMPAFFAWWEHFSIPRQETVRLVKKIIMPILLEC
jgi:hypothetical protein